MKTATIRVRGYHFGYNMAGYMPDSEVAHFNSRRDAVADAQWTITRFREDGYVVHGSAKGGDWWGEYRGKYSGPSYHFWVVPCTELDCQEDEEN